MVQTVLHSLVVLLLSPSTTAFYLGSVSPSTVWSYSTLNPKERRRNIGGQSKLYESPVTHQEEETPLCMEESVRDEEENKTSRFTSTLNEGKDKAFFSSSMWKSLPTSLGSSVDSSRIIYPEINDGEVNRMFSSLEYCPESGKAQHATGSVVGAAALVRSYRTREKRYSYCISRRLRKDFV